MTIGYPDWNATVIPATASRVVGGKSNLAVAIGAVVDLGIYKMPHPAYDIYLSLANSSGADVLTQATLFLDWYDDISGVFLQQDVWQMTSGVATGNPHQMLGHGPARGTRLSMSLANLATSATGITAQLSVISAARPESRATLETFTMGVGGIQDAAFALDINELAVSQVLAVAAGASVVRALPLYTGQARVCATTSSGLADLEVAIAPIPGWVAQTNPLFSAFTSGAGVMNSDAFLPRIQCQLTMTNHNAAAKDLAAWITTAELRV